MINGFKKTHCQTVLEQCPWQFGCRGPEVRSSQVRQSVILQAQSETKLKKDPLRSVKLDDDKRLGKLIQFPLNK